MNKAISRADKFVNERCKIYYPWKQVYVYRVIHKDNEGYYIHYEGKKRRLRIAVSDYGDFMRFELLHEGR